MNGNGQQRRPSLADARAPTRLVALSMPSRDMVPARFMYDVLRMGSMSAATLMLDGITDITQNMVEGTYIQSSRSDLVDMALAQGATHMLWLDTDHRFPRDALVRLLNHNVDMVGINYSTRKIPPDFVAYKHVGWDGEPSEKCVTDGSKSGLEEVDALGFGLVLMRMSVVRKIGPKPWFEVYYDTELNRIVGEDVYFCKLAKAAGITIYVDHDLSKECSHLGTMEYRLEHAADWKELNDSGDYNIHGTHDGDRELAEPQ